MLACLLAYLLESNDCLRRYAGLLGIRLPKTSLGMVSRAMEVEIEEATLPFPNRELRIRKSRRRRISMLACLLAYLLESYACLLACLPTRIQRLFASVCRISWHKASEDEPEDGDRGLVSPMRLPSGDEEATLPFPNRELRIRNCRRRRISMLACFLLYLLETYACLLFALLTRINALLALLTLP